MKLTPFMDALLIPKRLRPCKRGKDWTYYEVRMKEVCLRMHSELPPTKVWGYEGQVPGPVIEAKRGECVKVKWINHLPEEHFLPVDHTLHGAGENMPEVRTVVHLHGAEVQANSDGYPEDWFTKDFKQTGPGFEHEVYEYPNRQRATTLWYHDHAIGITRLNVYAGLAGMYIIREGYEKMLGLPSGPYEIPLIISDKGFNEDGSLFYPRNVSDPPPSGYPDPSVTPGEAFDFITVNGKVWPHLEVEPRKYRFRILNASNERFYRMALDSNQPFFQIGSDGGLLESPVELSEITIAPSERVDVIIDFSKLPVGTSIVMTNSARVPFDFGAPPDPETTGKIMQFRVVELEKRDKSIIPPFLSYIKRYHEYSADKVRDISLDVTNDSYGRLKFLLSNKGFMEPVTEKPHLNDIEVWRMFMGYLQGSFLILLRLDGISQYPPWKPSIYRDRPNTIFMPVNNSIILFLSKKNRECQKPRVSPGFLYGIALFSRKLPDSFPPHSEISFYLLYCLLPLTALLYKSLRDNNTLKGYSQFFLTSNQLSPAA